MEQGGANGGARRRTGGARDVPDDEAQFRDRLRMLTLFCTTLDIIKSLTIMLFESAFYELGLLGRLAYFAIMMLFIFPVLESLSSRYGVWLPATWGFIITSIQLHREFAGLD